MAGRLSQDLGCHHASPVQPPFQEGQHILANQLVEAADQLLGELLRVKGGGVLRGALVRKELGDGNLQRQRQRVDNLCRREFVPGFNFRNVFWVAVDELRQLLLGKAPFLSIIF